MQGEFWKTDMSAEDAHKKYVEILTSGL
jgi:hypothetical protein